MNLLVSNLLCFYYSHTKKRTQMDWLYNLLSQRTSEPSTYSTTPSTYSVIDLRMNEEIQKIVTEIEANLEIKSKSTEFIEALNNDKAVVLYTGPEGMYRSYQYVLNVLRRNVKRTGARLGYSLITRDKICYFVISRDQDRGQVPFLITFENVVNIETPCSLTSSEQ